MKAQKDEFNVLNHGDLWLNNIMFRSDEGGLITTTKFVDFQMGVFASPAIDLLYFIMLSIESNIIVTKFDHIIDYYHQHLSQSLKTLGHSEIPSLKQLQIDILKKSFYGATQMCEGISTLQIDHEKDDVNLGIVDLDSEAGNLERKKILNNPRYLGIIAKLIPFLGERGMLDLL